MSAILSRYGTYKDISRKIIKINLDDGQTIYKTIRDQTHIFVLF
jgi:hypothetical protein